MKVLVLVLGFVLVGSSYAVDRVFFVDQKNNSIYYSDIQAGDLLTDHTYRKANLKYIKAPGVMTYDRVNDDVIWSQPKQRKIRVDSIRGISSPIDISSHVIVAAITFNDFDRRIYWFGNVSNRIKTMFANGTDKIILFEKMKKIYGLSVDGLRGFLYFAEQNQIVRMNVDGSGEIALLDTGLSNVTAFARNAQENCLYWLNGPGSIERYNITTNERSTLHDISHLIGNVEQIVVYDGVFYWADSERGGIGYVDLADASNHGFVTVIKTITRNTYGLGGIMDLKVFTDAEVDSCSLFPCGEDATCITQDLSYVCLHNNSFANITANTTEETPEQINPCIQYPCDNHHGFCVNEGGKPVCTCMLGFDLAEDLVTCQPQENCTNCNYGECVLEDGIFKCVCSEGFRPSEGDNAQCEDIDECESSPCDPEYGACVNTVGAFHCPCPPGYINSEDGITCQVNCMEDPCHNGGTCSEDQCLCPEGFMDELCQHENDQGSNEDDEGEAEELESGSHYDESDDDDDDDDETEGRRVPVPVIITIVIILIIILLLIVIILVFYRRKKNKNKQSA